VAKAVLIDADKENYVFYAAFCCVIYSDGVWYCNMIVKSVCYGCSQFSLLYVDETVCCNYLM
jgi:hypothetical protein